MTHYLLYDSTVAAGFLLHALSFGIGYTIGIILNYTHPK